MKQLHITFLLTVLMSMAGAKTFAHDIAVTNDDGVTIYYKWANNKTELAVSYGSGYYSNKYSGNVVIPESVTYNSKTYRVTSIGDAAFSGCTGLTSVTIPNSVTSIGNQAFAGCTGLTSVEIPNSVTSIGEKAFAWCTGTLTVNCNIPDASSNDKSPFEGSSFSEVSFGNDVAFIGDYAFYGCSSIITLSLPNSLESIGYEAFFCCTGLTSVTIPNSMTSIGNSAFVSCSGLTSIEIPNSVTSIGDYAFSGCSGLTSVTIPNSVTIIGGGAFFACTELTSVEIPNSVTSIGSYAFYNTAWYSNKPDGLVYAGKVAYMYKGTMPANTSIVLEEGTLVVADYAFSGCTGLTSVEIPNSVTNIGNYAFYGCTGLTSVTIPNSVTSIGGYAFQNCSGLRSVTIGSGVLSIGSDVFKNAKPTKVIWLTNTPPNGYSKAAGTVNYVANDLYTSLSSKTVYPFLSSMFEVDGVKYVPVSPSERTCDAIDCLYDESTENIHIGETVTNKGIALTVKQVHPYAFYENQHIKDVDLSFNGNVGNNAFYGCTNVNSVVLNHGGDIGDYAFSGITSEFTANINNSGIIGSYAFKESTGITTLEIGNKVTNIYQQAFYGCTGLKTATINNKGSLDNDAFRDCTSLETATLGENITSIGTYAFSGCSSLKGIVIPDAVETLGQYAFLDCSQIATVAMGTGVKSIETYTFSNCSALTDMQIGSNVATINESAFSGCTSLPAINIPKAVTDIKNSVFSGCTSLKTVVIEDRETVLNLGSNGSSPLFSNCPLETVYIGGNISYPTSSSSGYSPFYRNTTLRDVTITDKETEISENEFYGCTSLKNVSIGDGVETIGNWAFSGCSSLDYFAFGSALKNIGKEAFSDCTAVTKIISKAKTPPVCDTQALDDINKWNCVLSVPQGTLSAYQAADQWKEFFFVEEHETGEDPVTITANDLTMVYGDNVPALTYKSEGAELQGTPSLSCEATSKSPVGTYPIVVSQGSVTNGNVTYVNGTLTITKAPLTIKAGNYTMVQGEELPAFTATYEGFKNGETESVLSKKPTFSTTVNASTAPGEYDLNVSGAEAQNYEFTYVPGKITVVAAESIVVTADNKTISYGQTIPELTYSVSGGELKGTPEIYCEATSNSPVGTYPIVISKGSVTNGNVTYVNGTLTITKAPLTIKAGNYTMVQGEELPTFTATYEGFKNGETESVLTTKPTLTTSATSSSDPGTYDVVVSGAKAQNYEISFVNGTLTITASSGISSLAQDGLYNVYDLTGRKIYQNQTELPKLPKGVYIVNGHTVVIK